MNSIMDLKMDFPISLLSTEMDFQIKVQMVNFPSLFVQLLFLPLILVFLLLYFKVNHLILFEALLISRLVS